VTLVDANLLIYAATVCPKQEATKTWLDGQLNGPHRVGIPWHSLLGFLRIVTNVRIYRDRAASIDEAWAQIESWLTFENVWVPAPSSRHAEFLSQALRSVPEGGELVCDAHLAALAMEHGLILCSSDRDFARFPGLKWMNPLSIS
jgi:uncharacterized protein